jgi:hypothetical protein
MEREAAGEMLQNCLIGQVSYNLLFRFLYFHQVEDLTSLSDTLLDVGIGTFPAEKVKTCRLDDSVAHALSLLSENGISGLPVLDGAGKPVDIFVDKDLMSLTSLDFEVTVEKALEMVSSSHVCHALSLKPSPPPRCDCFDRDVDFCRRDLEGTLGMLGASHAV